MAVNAPTAVRRMGPILTLVCVSRAHRSAATPHARPAPQGLAENAPTAVRVTNLIRPLECQRACLALDTTETTEAEQSARPVMAVNAPTAGRGMRLTL
jgi:hypothetical protein